MLNRYLPGILSLFPEKKFKHVTVVVTPAVYVVHEGDVWLLEDSSTEWCIEDCPGDTWLLEESLAEWNIDDSSVEWKLSSIDASNDWKIEVKRVC